MNSNKWHNWREKGGQHGSDSFWVQVHKGYIFCDCFNLTASASMAGMLFVCVPRDIFRAGYMGILMNLCLGFVFFFFICLVCYGLFLAWIKCGNWFLYWNGRFLFLFWAISLLLPIGLGDLREEVSHYREL